MIGAQLGNVNLSSVRPAQTSEAGGLQGTGQNLGLALGTAVIGSILLTSLTGAFDREVASNPDLPPHVRTAVANQTESGIQFVPASDAETIARKSGLDTEQASRLADSYDEAQIRALKTALGGVAVVVLLGFALTRRLPREPITAPA